MRSLLRKLPKPLYKGLTNLRFHLLRWIGKPTVVSVFVGDTKILVSTTADVTDWRRVEWGENVFIWHHTILDSHNGISIGEWAQIGTKVGIFTHSSHVSIRLMGRRYIEVPFDEHIGRIKGKVHIGAFTFVGANSIIMPNTEIGRGCVVSAFSYVSGTFPDFSIIAGNPARRVGDSRSLDRRALLRHPELRAEYEAIFGANPPDP
jgi:acetyltransferase-like isoleucine patch superfamily enzyme